VKRELGFKVKHREVTEVTRTYTLREQSEIYGSNFTHENEALSSENIRFGTKILKFQRLGLVRPPRLETAGEDDPLFDYLPHAAHNENSREARGTKREHSA